MLDDNDNLDFGHLPPAVDQLLQQGVAAHFSDRALAERHFLAALTLAPDALPSGNATAVSKMLTKIDAQSINQVDAQSYASTTRINKNYFFKV